MQSHKCLSGAKVLSCVLFIRKLDRYYRKGCGRGLTLVSACCFFFCSFTSIGVNFWMVGCLEFWCCFGVVFFSLVTLLPVLLNNRVSVCTVGH